MGTIWDKNLDDHSPRLTPIESGHPLVGLWDAYRAKVAEKDAEIERLREANAGLSEEAFYAAEVGPLKVEIERLRGLLIRVENAELNGRLCRMPDFENEEVGCPSCRKLWADIRAALNEKEPNA